MAVNFTTPKGSTFIRRFYIKDISETKQSLLGFSFRGDIKSTVGGATIASFSFTVIDDFTISAFLSADTTAAIPAGEYVYDIERFTAADAFVSKVFTGTITFTEEVTT